MSNVFYNNTVNDYVDHMAKVYKHDQEVLVSLQSRLIRNCIHHMTFFAADNQWLDAHKVCTKLHSKGFGAYCVIQDVIDGMIEEGSLELLTINTPNAEKHYIRSASKSV
jgi:hypothetical protein